MTNTVADNLLNERLQLIKETLGQKAKEYARNEDRMHNFNKAAEKSGKTREECLDGFRLKHVISVDDMRQDIKNGKLPTLAQVREKFGDIINYYILEEMSITHRIMEDYVDNIEFGTALASSNTSNEGSSAP